MRKKVCPRPQCAKEYLEGEGFDDLTVCKLCGAPLEDVFVDDYDIEEQSDEFEENTDYETEDVICEDDMSYEEDIVDNNDIEDTEETFEDRNCFIDIDIVDDKLKSEVILAEEDVDSDENDDENMEGYILGEIDKEFTRISREANPEYANRRIDLYKKWL